MVQEALVADPRRPSVPEQRRTHSRLLTKPDCDVVARRFQFTCGDQDSERVEFGDGPGEFQMLVAL